MQSVSDTYTLSNGVKIPSIGFGTWQVSNGEEAISSVQTALSLGYRHIDTAQGYGNEQSVGEAVKRSGLKREDVFITSKLWNSQHGYDKTMSAFDKSLQQLGMDYLDLFLIHWPNPVMFRDHWQEANAGTWKAFEELYKAGRIKSIGISNFHKHHIEELLKTATIKPMVNQIRLCPGDTQDALVDYSRSQGMLLEAYSPLGVGKIFSIPEMQDMAKKYNKSIAQIAIRWSLQRGYLPLPKSTHADRIKENLDVFDFEISDSDAALIAGLTGAAGFSADPDTTTF